MYRVFQIVLMGMGGLFMLELIAISYFVVVDPFHLRPLVLLLWKQQTAETSVPETFDNQTVTVGASSTPLLTKGSSTTVEGKVQTAPVPKTSVNDAQADALKTVGINPETVVQSITPTQLDCFTSILGAGRVAEIKSGAVPTAAEFLRVSSCL
jgi:hypothetical protein